MCWHEFRKDEDVKLSEILRRIEAGEWEHDGQVYGIAAVEVTQDYEINLRLIPPAEMAEFTVRSGRMRG